MESEMRTLILVTLMLGGCAMTPQQQSAAADRAAAADTEFHKALAGLTPRETNSCMPSRQQASLSAYGSKLVYRVSPSLAYVTDTAGGCEGVARGDVLVTRSVVNGPCQGDIATTVDQGSRMQTGSCGIGSFTTWRK
jgi:hypothetical protein